MKYVVKSLIKGWLYAMLYRIYAIVMTLSTVKIEKHVNKLYIFSNLIAIILINTHILHRLKKYMNDRKRQSICIILTLVPSLLQKFIQNLVTQFSYTLENVQL